jgi:5-(carboxyamino)imidazole ribonucleotide synthase
MQWGMSTVNFYINLPLMSSLTATSVLGILGGGQLGRMLLQKALDWNITSLVVDGDAEAPCRYLTEHFINRPYRDYETVLEAGRKCTHLTIEIEHVNTEALFQLEKEGIKVFPQPRILQVIQDKGLQKEFYRKNQIATSGFFLVDGKDDLLRRDLKFPFILKLRNHGYDGKGVMKINTAADLNTAFDAPCVVEDHVAIEKEISVIAARNEEGQCAFYPPVEMVFNPKANLVDYLFAPADLSDGQWNRALELARSVVERFRLTGIMAVEMFLTKSGELLVNESAPRPHNSGHHTIEANVTSQYEQLLRTIFNLPLGSTGIISTAAMINLLGEEGQNGPAVYSGLEEALKMEGVYVHLYGKKITKPFRKMGHVTVTASTTGEALLKAQKIKSLLKVIS